MSFEGWMHLHRRSLLFLVTILTAAGLAATFRIPVSLFPSVDFPRVRVSLDAGDRSAERMALEVTRPAEEAVRAVPGVRSVRSTSSRGSGEIDVQFDWGQDMIPAMLQVQAAIQQVSTAFPPGTQVVAARMDPTVFPVLAYSLTSPLRSGRELRDLAVYQLRPMLASIRGVARLGVQGGQTEEYRVTLDPARMGALGLSFSEVARLVGAAHTLQAVGRLEDHDKLYLVISDPRSPGLETLGDTVLRGGPDGVVRLRDLASIRVADAPSWTRATADGREAVLLQVYQQPSGNTVQIAQDIKQALEACRTRIPSDVRIANWYDQSELITSAAGSVRDALLVGVLMAAVILLVFLRNLKITLLAILTVPAVLAMTVLLLHLLGMSFNVMTLGGMAAAVGLIIDDAIVMVEHIVRRMRSRPDSRPGQVLSAAREFTRPLAGSSLATLVIFAPLAFLSGVTGAFFKALSLTMASGLLISFLVAWLILPLLVERFLDEGDARQKEGGPLTERVNRRYARLMKAVFEHPGWLLAGLGLFVLAGALAFQGLGSGFMPSMDEGGFVLDYRTPSGTSLSETDRVARQMEAILKETPEVETYSRRTGLGLGGTLSEANEGDFFVRLKPFPRRELDAVIDDVRGRLESRVPGVKAEMAKLMEDLVGDLTAVPQPIEIKIFSDDEATLSRTALRIAEALRKRPGVVDVKDGLLLAGDALEIRIDPAKAALEGLDPDGITAQIQAWLSGGVPARIQKGPKMVDVRIWSDPALRKKTRDVQDLILQAPDGHPFPLGRVASVEALSGQPQIQHEDFKRMVAVTARISGRDMGSVISDVKRTLETPGLVPKEVTTRLGGLYEQQRIAFRGLTAVSAGAAALLFFLLLFLFEHFRQALAVLLTALLSLGGVFLGLRLSGTELNISSLMGMTMVLGIVSEVAIFLVWEFHALPWGLDRREALIQAGQHRMRAITMSTLAAVLALLPLALGPGQGAAMQKPLAIAIISGLLFQLPLVFLVMPGLFAGLRAWGCPPEGSPGEPQP